MTATRRRGTNWSIWDLHVHSPSSVVQGYGADDDETWNTYLDALEALPAEIKVIGLNDYWFLDGYRRVCQARKNGRLKNLDAVFPILELRLDQFGGTTHALKRVNLHVIFDPDLDADLIDQQFLNRLHASFVLDADASNTWSGVVTRDSMAALGRAIKAGVPEDELSQYGSDLQEGFNNLNLPLQSVLDALDSSFLKGKALLGLGKTEWAAIKWNDQTIASKKNIISRADFLFTAFDDAGDWPRQVKALKDAGVNHKILDCSDAHTWAESENKDRLGQCQTWFNSTPTFAGLIHALSEFDRRVYVGLEPEASKNLRSSPEQYIRSVTLSTSDPEKYPAFDYRLPLNSGFVAIVGNKGQGKSALLDCIAAAGNSARSHEFAFLNPTRFLSASNKAAKEYSSTLEWETGLKRTIPLTQKHDTAVPTQVEYLPQKYVERVCTVDPLSDESHEFENELRDVLFTHIPDQDREGEVSFDALVGRKTQEAREKATSSRGTLRRLSKDYEDLARYIDQNDPDAIRSRIVAKREEIRVAQESLEEAEAAAGVIDEASGDDQRVELHRQEAVQVREELQSARNALALSQLKLAESTRDAGDFDGLWRRVEALYAEASEINATFADLDGGVIESAEARLVSVTKNDELARRWQVSHAERVAELKTQQQLKSGEINSFALRERELASALAAADSSRELARQRVLQGVERISTLRGTVDQPGTLINLESNLGQAEDAPAKLAQLAGDLIAVSYKIHASLLEELDAVIELYAPASAFIADSAVVQNAGLQFQAALEYNAALLRVGSALDGRRNPDLGAWISDIPSRVTAMLWDDLRAELEQVLMRLGKERGAERGEARSPLLALRAVNSLEDFLVDLLGLEWLEVRFGLTGDGLPLAQLSPGQRGLVLALFYLIVDRRATPLLLDQPEENLDNATISSLLVPAIREASTRRQTIIVTHNANLAVVGDADQIIHATVNGGVFDVTSGCISELDVAKSAVDILEGTKPAFDSRRHKYEAFPALS